MRKWNYWQMSIFVLVFITSADVFAEAIFSENFSVDPEWTSTEPGNVKWAPAGFYRARVSDDPTDWVQYGYSPVFQEVNDLSFTLEFDINPISPSWGTYPGLALTTEGSNDYYYNQPLSVDAAIANDWPQVFVMHIKPYGGSPPITFLSPTFNAGEWYHQRVDYDAQSNTLIWEIHNSSGELFHYEIYTDISIVPFNQVAVGYKSAPPVYGSWAEIYVDNINIYTVSKPLCSEAISGDLNGDCKVDFEDFAIMALHWLDCSLQPPSACWQ